MGIEQAHLVLTVFFLTCPHIKRIQNNAQAPTGILIFLFFVFGKAFLNNSSGHIVLVVMSQPVQNKWSVSFILCEEMFNNVFALTYFPSAVFTLK